MLETEKKRINVTLPYIGDVLSQKYSSLLNRSLGIVAQGCGRSENLRGELWPGVSKNENM